MHKAPKQQRPALMHFLLPPLVNLSDPERATFPTFPRCPSSRGSHEVRASGPYTHTLKLPIKRTLGQKAPCSQRTYPEAHTALQLMIPISQGGRQQLYQAISVWGRVEGISSLNLGHTHLWVYISRPDQTCDYCPQTRVSPHTSLCLTKCGVYIRVDLHCQTRQSC